jgi:hypothetical protein
LEYNAQRIIGIKKDITRYLIISCDIKVIKKIEGDISLYLYNLQGGIERCPRSVDSFPHVLREVAGVSPVLVKGFLLQQECLALQPECLFVSLGPI